MVVDSLVTAVERFRPPSKYVALLLRVAAVISLLQCSARCDRIHLHEHKIWAKHSLAYLCSAHVWLAVTINSHTAVMFAAIAWGRSIKAARMD